MNIHASTNKIKTFTAIHISWSLVWILYNTYNDLLPEVHTVDIVTVPSTEQWQAKEMVLSMEVNVRKGKGGGEE